MAACPPGKIAAQAPDLDHVDSGADDHPVYEATSFSFCRACEYTKVAFLGCCLGLANGD